MTFYPANEGAAEGKLAAGQSSAAAEGMSDAGEGMTAAAAEGMTAAAAEGMTAAHTGSRTQGSVTDRPHVLVIAGYDQSAGAGLLSDIKTLEMHGVYGYGVCTGFTFQNERTINRIQWFSENEIFEQIDLCFASAVFDWVKIGITQSMKSAAAIIRHLRLHNPDIRIVLDPVIKATSGQDFWTGVAQPDADDATRQADARRNADGISDWEFLAEQCYLITPNWEEMGWLYPNEDILQKCRFLTRQSGDPEPGKLQSGMRQSDRHIYLKGGHHPQTPGRDYLWTGGDVVVLDPAGTAPDLVPVSTATAIVPAHAMSAATAPLAPASAAPPPVYPKHGSGCVLSSALTANLALGHPLPVAAKRAKRYTEQFLTSNKTLLGWHRPPENPI
jgi:hydroxymethylpyrimidine/phosphomethylpyrimidine kinase